MLMIKTVFKRLWLSCRKVKDNPHECIVCNAFLLNLVKFLWYRPEKFLSAVIMSTNGS